MTLLQKTLLAGSALACSGLATAVAAPTPSAGIDHKPSGYPPLVFVEFRSSLRRLAPSPEQMRTIEGIFSGSVGDALVTSLDALIQSRRALRRAIWAGEDDATLVDLGSAVGRTVGQIAVAQAGFEKAVDELLTPSQRRRLLDMRAEYDRAWRDPLARPLNADLLAD